VEELSVDGMDTSPSVLIGTGMVLMLLVQLVVKFVAAKEVSLIGVKVLSDDGPGSSATILKGIDYVIGRKRVSPKVPMIINMSLGGAKSKLENDAVKKATSRGITVVAAAGNEDGEDACTKSPASAKSAITVGATDYYNYVSSFSNGGSCVDIMAPGSNIYSVTSSDACSSCLWYTLKSGTSMAAPLVAGIAALHLQKNKGLKPYQVMEALASDARTGVVIDYWGYNVRDLLLSATTILE
jgi:serine protease